METGTTSAQAGAARERDAESRRNERVVDLGFIDVSLLVRVPEDHAQAWHELTLEIDGKRQWHRRIASNCPGQTDGLDYHCRVVLEAGPALRIRAVALTRGSVVQRLLIEAREDL